eukprot:s1753_g1.t1
MDGPCGVQECGRLFCLKRQIDVDENGIHIAPNAKYTPKLAELLEVTERRGKTVPHHSALVVFDAQVIPMEGCLDMEGAKTFRSALGICLYIAQERLDIQQTGRVLSSYMGRPAKTALCALQKLGSYLVQTQGGQSFSRSPEGLCSGLIFLNGCCIHSHSRAQASSSLSSMDAEILAATSLVVEGIMVKQVLQFLLNDDGGMGNNQQVQMRLWLDSPDEEDWIGQSSCWRSQQEGQVDGESHYSFDAWEFARMWNYLFDASSTWMNPLQWTSTMWWTMTTLALVSMVMYWARQNRKANIELERYKEAWKTIRETMNLRDQADPFVEMLPTARREPFSGVWYTEDREEEDEASDISVADADVAREEAERISDALETLDREATPRPRRTTLANGTHGASAADDEDGTFEEEGESEECRAEGATPDVPTTTEGAAILLAALPGGDGADDDDDAWIDDSRVKEEKVYPEHSR